jgi:hypothetical protein
MGSDTASYAAVSQTGEPTCFLGGQLRPLEVREVYVKGSFRIRAWQEPALGSRHAIEPVAESASFRGKSA